MLTFHDLNKVCDFVYAAPFGFYNTNIVDRPQVQNSLADSRVSRPLPEKSVKIRLCLTTKAMLFTRERNV